MKQAFALILLAGFTSIGAHAAQCPQRGRGIIENAVGFSCTSAAGDSFTIVQDSDFGKGIKGPGGLVYSGNELIKIEDSNFDMAVKTCASLHARLPSKAELQTAIKNWDTNELSDTRELWIQQISHVDSKQAYRLGEGISHTYLLSSPQNSVSQFVCVKGGTPNAKSTLPECDSRGSRNKPVGFKCLSSTSHVFTRVQKNGFGEAWQDGQKNIWSDIISASEYRPEDEKCKNLGAEVPSQKQFLEGQKDGINEVLPNMIDKTFWSSTVVQARYWVGTYSVETNLTYEGGYDLWQPDPFFEQNPAQTYQLRCVAHP
jgi:hypothetical protein